MGSGREMESAFMPTGANASDLISAILLLVSRTMMFVIIGKWFKSIVHTAFVHRQWAIFCIITRMNGRCQV